MKVVALQTKLCEAAAFYYVFHIRRKTILDITCVLIVYWI